MKEALQLFRRRRLFIFSAFQEREAFSFWAREGVAKRKFFTEHAPYNPLAEASGYTHPIPAPHATNDGRAPLKAAIIHAVPMLILSLFRKQFFPSPLTLVSVRCEGFGSASLHAANAVVARVL
mgnify:CR=1 FL=1